MWIDSTLSFLNPLTNVLVDSHITTDIEYKIDSLVTKIQWNTSMATDATTKDICYGVHHVFNQIKDYVILKPVNCYLPRDVQIICERRYVDFMYVHSKSPQTTSQNCEHGLHEFIDKGCILDYLVCDGKPDCLDGSDENYCPCLYNVTRHGMLLTLNSTCICNNLYLLNTDGDCVPLGLVSEIAIQLPLFISLSGSKMTTAYKEANTSHHALLIKMTGVTNVTDAISGMKLLSKFNVLVTNYYMEMPSGCDEGQRVFTTAASCLPFIGACYEETKTCTYDLTSGNHLMFCSNGAHPGVHIY